ncbi:MAG: SLC13 family permease [Bacteroidetes bacterium]|nr:SLC13 family permease [Bacteroidota bacterium]
MKKISIHIWISFFGLISFLGVYGLENTFENSIFLGVLMIYLWITEAIPIYVTALLPFVLGVPFGILSTTQLAAAYGDKNVFLFLGGFLLALALEKWHVHTQVARAIIHSVGFSKPRLILGFLVSTAFLSMWISNTATTLMMLPMGLAIISVLPRKDQKSKFTLYLMLAIAYGASVGGMATLVGSPPNIQMAGILKQNNGITVDFISWFKVGFPLVVILIGCIYLYFYLMLGKAERKENPQVNLPKQPWTTNQLRTIAVFSLVVVLWTFKTFIVDWFGIPYGDESAAILGSFLLFIVPGKNEKRLLNWSDTEKLPWGILILFGGGLALAGCLETNGVIAYVSEILMNLNGIHYFTLLLILISIAIFGTEIMSNLALVTVFVPVIAAFAENSSYSVLQLCIPVTLAASCAFMLPVGTPPNAIVFSSGKIKIRQMVKVGMVLNLMALLIITMAAYFFM